MLNRLIRLRYGLKAQDVLNLQRPEPADGESPQPKDLSRLVSALKRRAAGQAWPTLDYLALPDSDAYRQYRGYVAALSRLDLRRLGSRQNRLAFWINLYNGLILDAVILWRVRRSVREIPGFFWRARYNVGGHLWSANDIENGVLRANSPHPALPFRPFADCDPRRQFVMDSIDPRLHFALVCASRSCPPFAAYDEAHLHDQLTTAAKSFIGGGGVELDSAGGVVRLSRIFQWYAGDFGAGWLGLGNKRPLLNFLHPYLSADQRALLSSRRAWRVVFNPYDWSLNGIRAA